MQLRINGKSHQVGEPTERMNLQTLLETLGYEPRSIAVAVDGQFVPRHRYAHCMLHDDQDLEVVAPMQGG